MNPLQQIADSLSAAGLDHPAVDDAVIKLTNMAGGEPVAWVNGDDLVSDEQVKWYAKNYPSTSDMYANYLPLYAHPSRGVVDEVLPEMPESFARVCNDGYWLARVAGTARFDVHDSRSGNAAQDVYSADQMRDYALAALQAAALPAVLEGNRAELLAEDIEAFHMAMDNLGFVPRTCDNGRHLSMYGRAVVGMTKFATMQREAAINSAAELVRSIPASAPQPNRHANAATPAHDQPEGEG